MSVNINKEELSESGTGTGIEADNEEELILEPFDPESISIEPKVIAMDTLIRRLKQGSIHLSPGFQRAEVWDQTRRSRLIESIILRIPLPMFYVAANAEGRWEVVDGLQRLSTIRNFILGDGDGNKLKLKNLEFLGKSLNGKTFSDIDREAEKEMTKQRLVNTIMETEMRFTVINPGTPEAVKRNIFKRINTGGMPLTSQEIRHALYQGKSSELLSKLVCSAPFKKAIQSKINDSRMGARELVLRFISFLIMSRNDYKSSMDTWLSNTMRIINCMPELDSEKLNKIYPDSRAPYILYGDTEEIEYLFNLAMTRNNLIFGQHAFRKSLPGERKTPINKALFETWSNTLCKLDELSFNLLVERKEALFSEYKILLRDIDFNNAISRNASQPKEVIERHTEIVNLINRVLEN
jgi:hypothetical protein